MTNGTVCMTSSYYNGSYSVDGYYSDFEGDIKNTTITTTEGLETTGLTKEEIEKINCE